MELINRITTYIINLSEKDFQKYFIVVISVITFSVAGSIYYIYSKSSKLVKEIKQVQQLSEKSTAILINNSQIQKEEDRIQELLSNNKDFSIKSYFEQFCREQHITPEPNWETTPNPIEGNEKFEEVTLRASFKNETTKTLVTILDALDKNEIVYLTELKIKKDKDKIGFDIVIATKKLRHVVEE